MKTISFHDRTPFPRSVTVGMASDINAETVCFCTPPIHRNQREFIYLRFPTPDYEPRIDVVTLDNHQLIISEDIASVAGDIVCYLEICAPDGAVLWHSDVFTLSVRRMNDNSGRIEDYPPSLHAAMRKAGKAIEAAENIKELSVETTTLNPDQEATAEYDAETGVLHLGIPRGESGDTVKWDTVKDKPFERLGETLVSRDGTLDINLHETVNSAGGRTFIIGK